MARYGDVIQIGSSVCRVVDGQPVRDRIPQPVGGGNCTMLLLLENFAINGKGSVIRFPDGTVAESRGASALHGPSAATVAGDAICVVDRDRHSLVCLDVADGKVRWRKDLPAVVDAPPTLAGGCALFGGHDGRVYCLSLADGAVVWRARAAPADDWWMAYGQLASRWPVIGAVVIEGDTVLATAGWTVGRDGGIFAVAFGLADGATRWARVLSRPRQKVMSKELCFNDVSIANARGVPVLVEQCLRPEPEASAAVFKVPQEGLVQSDLRTRGRFEQIVRGVRGLSLGFDDDLVFSAGKHGMAAFAPDHKAGQPPRLGKLSIQGGAPCRRPGRRCRRGCPGTARWHGEADRLQPHGRRGGDQRAVAGPAGPRWPGHRRRRDRRRLC